MSLAWGMIAAGVALTVIGLIGLGVCVVKALAIRRADDPESGGDALRRLAALNMASLGIASFGLGAVIVGLLLR